MDRERVGRYVEQRRAELNMSRREFAERADIDPKTLYALESGNRWPHTTTRYKIEAELGWPAGALDRIADGGEPEVEQPQPPKYADPGLQAIWEIAHLTELERRMAIIAVQAWRQNQNVDEETRQSGTA